MKPYDQWPVLKTFAIAFLAFIYCINLTSAHVIDHLISDSFIGHFSNEIYQASKTSAAVSAILLTTYIFCLAFILAKSLKHKKGIFTISSLLLAVAVWIAVDDFWLYPSVSGWPGDFKWWLVAGLTLTAILLPLLAHRNELKTVNDVEEDRAQHGFSPVQQSRLVDKENITFVENLIEKLKNTDVSESAFSLGIVGEWGAGKTVYLNSIREGINKNYNETPVVFNPWLGMTDQSIVHSFFNILSEKINEDLDIELESPLREYASALVSIEGEGGIFSKILSIFGDGNESNIFKLKETISKALKQARRKIFIVIDDLDRLSGEELFEVLRLIRVTADFPNLYYITAYDRAYVEAALASYGIEQSKRYLDKIFNVEITLPKATASQLSSLFRNEMNTVDSSLDDATVDTWSKGAIEYLHTFRDIKRFVREYSLTESLMANHITNDEYLKEDLFYLELLKYYDPELFKSIRDYPEKVLGYTLNSDGVFWFELKSEDSDKGERLYDSRWLVRQLFGKEHPDQRSIRYLSNFQRYFTYVLHSDVIKRIDFRKWSEANDDEAAVLFETMKRQAANGFSLLFHLSSFPSEKLTTSKLQAISGYLISNFFASANHFKSSKEIYFSILGKAYLKEGQIELPGYFRWLEDFFEDLELSFSVKAKLLKMIRTGCEVAMDDIRNLEKSNLLNYLQTEHPDPADIAHKGSLLHELYSNSIVWSHHTYFDHASGDEVSVREGNTPLFETLIEYFQENPGDKESKQNLYNSMFTYDTTDVFGETYIEEIDDETAEGEAIKVFGSYKKYEQYFDKAFA